MQSKRIARSKEGTGLQLTDLHTLTNWPNYEQGGGLKKIAKVQLRTKSSTNKLWAVTL